MGVTGGLIGAAVNRTATLEIALAGKRPFASTLRQTLTDLGYVEIPPSEDQAANLTIYARPRLAGLFSGKIFVQLDPNRHDRQPCPHPSLPPRSPLTSCPFVSFVP